MGKRKLCVERFWSTCCIPHTHLALSEWQHNSPILPRSPARTSINIHGAVTEGGVCAVLGLSVRQTVLKKRQYFLLGRPFITSGAEACIPIKTTVGVQLSNDEATKVILLCTVGTGLRSATPLSDRLTMQVPTRRHKLPVALSCISPE